jgi:Adenylate and Guanylate cyclase catalytic domain/3'5'-cyclic nucleotide phosphodiesterase
MHSYTCFVRLAGQIETIGDSYVCVTGVPDPKDDHAVSMTRFAFECLQRFNRLTKQLETQLGPSTGDLQARIGMHSGSVTAGVIRGERARFQLFGDTMNTASRMESNGLPGQIQVSEATAQLLRQAGKERWLTARKELVNAKGKGKMQTYWVSPSRKAKRTGQAASSSDGNSDAGESMYCQDIHLDTSSLDPSHDSIDFQIREASRAGKRMRLVDWNVEILAGFLRKVVAGRDQAGGRPRLARGGSKASVFALDLEARNLGVSRGGSVLDELTEAIEMPRFDVRQARRIEECDRAELDPVVKGQLREYVMRISSMYRNLDFHDFEHASHVTMSASKLLGRLTKRTGAGDDERPADSDREIHSATFGISSDPLLQFAIVFAALIHDVDHAGLTNAQLVHQKAPAGTCRDVPLAEHWPCSHIASHKSLTRSHTFAVISFCGSHLVQEPFGYAAEQL